MQQHHQHDFLLRRRTKILYKITLHKMRVNVLVQRLHPVMRVEASSLMFTLCHKLLLQPFTHCGCHGCRHKSSFGLTLCHWRESGSSNVFTVSFWSTNVAFNNFHLHFVTRYTRSFSNFYIASWEQMLLLQPFTLCHEYIEILSPTVTQCHECIEILSPTFTLCHELICMDALPPNFALGVSFSIFHHNVTSV